MKIIRTRQAQKIRVANGWQCRTCFVFQTILVSTILCHTPIEKFMASLCQMARPDQRLAMWVRESRRLRRVHFWGLRVEENCESFSHWGNVKKICHISFVYNGIPNSGFTCWKKILNDRGGIIPCITETTRVLFTAIHCSLIAEWKLNRSPASRRKACSAGGCESCRLKVL